MRWRKKKPANEEPNKCVKRHFKQTYSMTRNQRDKIADKQFNKRTDREKETSNNEWTRRENYMRGNK